MCWWSGDRGLVDLPIQDSSEDATVHFGGDEESGWAMISVIPH